MLGLFAEQGSGKSTTGRLLRSLVDPNSAPLRAEPKDVRDLMIAAKNSWCLAYDNRSHVPSWLSDAMCRLSTGDGFATRELYTDQDEIIFDSQRPVMLTSIEEVATRSDLLDRCLIVWLPTIPEGRRRPEAQMTADFEDARPRIIGALLDAVSAALRSLLTIDLPELPRMADFAVWVTACESGLGWQPGTFLAAYQGNRESANDLALESSPVGRPLLELLEERGEWSGTSGELLQALEGQVNDQMKRRKSWPSNSRSLSGHLRRLAPNLRAKGWQIDLLFPVSGKVPGGKERKTHKMMERDLEVARRNWIEEAETDADKEDRQMSDVLKYCDDNGLFADFHSNRHSFITNLEQAKVSPKMAQTLARHSDVRLTLGVYTHVGLHDQTAAILSLPAQPVVASTRRMTQPHFGRREQTERKAELRRAKTLPPRCPLWCQDVPKMVPMCLHRCGYALHQIAPKMTSSPANEATR